MDRLRHLLKNVYILYKGKMSSSDLSRNVRKSLAGKATPLAVESKGEDCTVVEKAEISKIELWVFLDSSINI